MQRPRLPCAVMISANGPQLMISAPGTRRPLFLPLRLGPLQQILGAGTSQMRAAVLHHHLAIDVAGLIRNQETREIGEFAVLTDTTKRILGRPALVAAFGPELAGGARGG